MSATEGTAPDPSPRFPLSHMPGHMPGTSFKSRRSWDLPASGRERSIQRKRLPEGSTCSGPTGTCLSSQALSGSMSWPDKLESRAGHLSLSPPHMVTPHSTWAPRSMRAGPPARAASAGPLQGLPPHLGTTWREPRRTSDHCSQKIAQPSAGGGGWRGILKDTENQ